MSAQPNVARIEFDPEEMNKLFKCMMEHEGLSYHGWTNTPVLYGVYIEYEDVNGRVYRVAVDKDSAHIDPRSGGAVATIANFKPEFDIEEAYISVVCAGSFYRIARIVPPKGKPVFQKGLVYDFDLVINFKPLTEAEPAASQSKQQSGGGGGWARLQSR